MILFLEVRELLHRAIILSHNQGKWNRVSYNYRQYESRYKGRLLGRRLVFLCVTGLAVHEHGYFVLALHWCTYLLSYMPACPDKHAAKQFMSYGNEHWTYGMCPCCCVRHTPSWEKCNNICLFAEHVQPLKPTKTWKPCTVIRVIGKDKKKKIIIWLFYVLVVCTSHL